VSPDSRIVQFSLPEADLARLNTWLPEIATSLRPDAPVHANGDEIRIGHKGSLALYPDGGWMDYEADIGGPDALTFIAHDTEQDAAGVRRFAIDWLRRHAGFGPLVPPQSTTNPQAARDRLHADWAREILANVVPVAGTPSEMNLNGRGLVGPYPDALVQHLPLGKARLGECGLIGLITRESGEVVGAQVGYLDPSGVKSTLPPQRNVFYLELDREQRRDALFRIDASTGDTELPGVTLVVEGVEKAIAVHMAFPGNLVLGLPGIGRMRRMPPIAGDVVMVRDGEKPGAKDARSLQRGVDHLLLTGTLSVRVTETPAGEDADSIIKARGIEALRELIRTAPVKPMSAEGEVHQAAHMRVLDYETEREEIAKRAGIRRPVLDRMVSARRAALHEVEDDPALAGAAALGPTPWDTPVDDIATVVREASNEIANYVLTSQAVRDAAALWGLFTHFVHHPFIQLEVAPQLGIKAAAPVCGKSTLLALLRHLTQHPLFAVSLTPALVHRVMGTAQPTLLLDECDQLLRRKSISPELLAVLRSTHLRATAFVPKLVPTPDGGWEWHYFPVFGAVAYTTIGDVEDALDSRAITLLLQKAKKLELRVIRQLRNQHSEVLAVCGRKFARWAQDQLNLPDADVPNGIEYRDHDNWRVLLRIAAAIGGEWPARAAIAAQLVNGTTVAVGDIVPLLMDVRAVFGKRDRLSTEELVIGLLALTEPSRDWTLTYRGRPINAYYLRDQLKVVVDPPENERRWTNGNVKVRGYLRCHFNDAFERYLPAEATP
jgi:hypothetical protein